MRSRGAACGLFLAMHVAVWLLFVLQPGPGTNAPVVGFPLDDAWIHLVYARSLATELGFHYNPGQSEAGFTSPLWTIVIAPLFWTGLSTTLLPVAVKLGCLLGGWLASIAAWRLASRLAGGVAGPVAGALVAIDPSLAFAQASGMEVMLASALLLLLLESVVATRWHLAGVLGALAILARPESFLIVALAVVCTLAAGNVAGTRTLALWPLGAGALWSLYCLTVTGRFLPNTFYVKHAAAGILAEWSDLGAVFGTALGDLPWFVAGSGLLLVGLGAWWVARRQPPHVAALAGLAPVVWMLGVSWAHDMRQPLIFYFNRYFQVGVPLLLVLIAAGVEHARVRRDRRVLALAAGAAALAGVIAWPGKLLAQADLYAWSCQNIQEMEVDVGSWLARAGGADDWIATHDAGAIRFFSGRPVLDMQGLNSREVIAEGVENAMARIQPRHVAFFPSWYPTLAAASADHVVYRVHASRYVICADCDQDVMIVIEPAP